MARFALIALFTAPLFSGTSFGQDKLTPAEQAKFFEKDVVPILQAHCLSCHGGEKKVKGGLHLTSRDGFLKGGESGPAVALEKPRASLFLQAIHYATDELRMPPKGKLPKAQIDILTRWVEMGLPWSAKKSLVSAKHGSPQVDDEARNFWSFKQPQRSPIPDVKNKAWVRTPVDAFILKKLEASGMAPNPPASKTALLRRIYYNLIGLPPTPEEVAAFLSDPSPDAYEKVVDRLLASPHYGERWARHWMDLVRYAESDSFERDNAKPHVWRYRDYVIDAFNSDKPYDQFIREQLAGDEMQPRTAAGLIATGYYRLGLWDDEPADPVLALYDELDDIVGTTSQVFLGLTANCARCHDHKIDPFPQKDYYRLLAFFHGFQRYGVRSGESVAKASLRPLNTPDAQKGHEKEILLHKERIQALKLEMKKIEDSVMPKLGGGEIDDFKFDSNKQRLVAKYAGPEFTTRYSDLKRQHTKLEKNPPAPLAMALCVTEIPSPRETFILMRGNPQSKGDKVEPGFPSVITPLAPTLPPPVKGAESSGRRTVLANWIASADNPLTARVMVNRLWQFHFGRGLVRTPSDFGYQGSPPTHPELLDWLATEFVRGGWKMKPIHRMLALSSVYQMSSASQPKAITQDPENDHFWRFDLRRLSAEEVRDSILAASGNLNLARGGPSVYPPIPKEVLAGQSIPGNGWRTSNPLDAARRSVYVHIKRSLAVPLLSAFDSADPDSSCSARFTTTQPAQALALINSEFIHEQAKIFAENAQAKAAKEAEQVRWVLRRTMQREPEQKQIDRGVDFMKVMREQHGQTDEQALRTFCLLALNLNEFLYLE